MLALGFKNFRVALITQIKIIDIEELQQEILQETEVNRLYEIQIDLSKLIKNAHQQNLMADIVTGNRHRSTVKLISVFQICCQSSKDFYLLVIN